MKKISFILICLILFSCATKVKTVADKPLYEILTEQSDGGANIRFFEILSEPDEIAMLQNDEKLKNKIHSTDTQTSNFIICNLGEKTSVGSKIIVESAVETENNVIVTLKEISPETNTAKSQETTTPYAILKINSKKEIIIK